MNIRRLFVASVLTLGALASSPIAMAQSVELKLATFIPAQHHMIKNAWQPMMDEVAEKSDGTLTIKLFPGGQLGSGGAEQYRRVVGGVADIAHGLPGYTSSQFPLTLLAEMPGVPASDRESTGGLWNAMPLLEEEWSRVKVLALYGTEGAMLMLRDKEVRSPDDLEGLKIRVPSSSIAAAVEAWGATPVSMPANEIYQAAQTGVIDGALLGGSTIMSFKLDEVFDHFTTGVPATSSLGFMLMNLDSYNKLSSEHKRIIDETTGYEFSQAIAESYLGAHEAGMARLRAQDKNTIELEPEMQQAFAELSSSVVDDRVAELEEDGYSNLQELLDRLGQPYQGD